MKRASLISCLFLCLTAPLVLSQSKPAPEVNRSAATLLGNVTNASAGSLFGPAYNYSFLGIPSGSPNSVAVGDVDGDGKPDLVVAFGEGGAGNQGLIAILLGNGDGTFHYYDSFGSGAGFASSVKVADLNGDGKLDLVVSNCGSAEDPGDCPNGSDGFVAIFLGNGDGTFHAPVLYDSGGGGALSVLVVDLNLDGKPDLVVENDCADPACTMGGGFGVMIGNGDGTFQSVVAYNGYGSTAVADLNGDGKPDLLLGSLGSNGSVTVLLGNGDGTFVSSGSFPLSESEVDAAAADLDGDGKLDIVTLTYNPNKTAHYVSVLKGNGDGTFQPQVRYPKLATYASHLAVADLNADGAPDVVVTGFQPHSSDGQLTVLLGKGNGKLGKAVIYESGGEGSFSVTIADLNGDGRLDLTAPDFWTDDIGILLNIGPYPTSVVLRSGLNPSTQGQAVTFTATIGSAGGAPSDGEIVTFKKGTKLLGNGTLTGGTASLTTSKLKVGTTAITAVYGGDSSFGPSTSNTVEQVVNGK